MDGDNELTHTDYQALGCKCKRRCYCSCTSGLKSRSCAPTSKDSVFTVSCVEGKKAQELTRASSARFYFNLQSTASHRVRHTSGSEVRFGIWDPYVTNQKTSARGAIGLHSTTAPGLAITQRCHCCIRQLVDTDCWIRRPVGCNLVPGTSSVERRKCSCGWLSRAGLALLYGRRAGLHRRHGQS